MKGAPAPAKVNEVPYSSPCQSWGFTAASTTLHDCPASAESSKLTWQAMPEMLTPRAEAPYDNAYATLCATADSPIFSTSNGITS